MAKRGTKNVKDGVSLLHPSLQDFDASFTPLPITPTKSPVTKKQRSADELTTNDDILKAVLELSGRFAALENKITQNTEAITTVCEQLKAVEFQVQKNENEIKEVSKQMIKIQQRSDEAERYSRRWNLRLYGKKETPEENIRAEIMKLFAALAPEEKEKMGFLIDNVHRVGVPRDNSNRPIIIQFNMQTFRNKIWKISRDNKMLKEQKLLLKEDLTQADRMERNRLWPLVEEARKQGKKAGFRGPHAYIEGKKVTH